MSKDLTKPYRLLVVAHPDDETLFFSGALLQKSKIPWKVICVTNGNADGAGKARAAQYKKACQLLGIKYAFQWDFPDIYEMRLDTESLVGRLSELPAPKEVYTHGIIGEYGHPHHQDVSYAVHEVFSDQADIWVPAYNAAAEKVFKLTESQYALKSKIYADVYQGETLRFSAFIPNRNVDEFMQLGWAEVHEIYSSIIEKREPMKKKLKKYRWFHSYLAEQNKKDVPRPF